MATTVSALKTRYRLETGDTDSGDYFVSDALLLSWIQDAVATFSRSVPARGSTTITVLAETVRYAAPSTIRRLIAVRDETDGVDAASPVPAELERLAAGPYILLAGVLPSAGTVLTAYYTANHAKPTEDDDSVLSGFEASGVDDAEAIDCILLLLREKHARKRTTSAGVSGGFTLGDYREDGSGHQRALLEEAAALRKEYNEKVVRPFAGAASANPHLDGQGPRPTLQNARDHQGTQGWTGTTYGDRRRPV